MRGLERCPRKRPGTEPETARRARASTGEVGTESRLAGAAEEPCPAGAEAVRRVAAVEVLVVDPESYMVVCRTMSLSGLTTRISTAATRLTASAPAGQGSSAAPASLVSVPTSLVGALALRAVSGSGPGRFRGHRSSPLILPTVPPPRPHAIFCTSMVADVPRTPTPNEPSLLHGLQGRRRPRRVYGDAPRHGPGRELAPPELSAPGGRGQELRPLPRRRQNGLRIEGDRSSRPRHSSWVPRRRKREGASCGPCLIKGP